VIRIDIGSLPEGYSHLDLEEDASRLDVDLEGVRLVSPVKVGLDVSRNGDEIVLAGRARVEAVLECARCLEEYSCALDGPVAVVVVVGEAPEGGVPAEEDVLRVPGGSKYADITQQVRSELLVHIPLKPLCKEDCKGLCPRCGIDLNCDRCSCHARSADSRWDALKDLRRDQ
jgi:uncharacterized protein